MTEQTEQKRLSLDAAQIAAAACVIALIAGEAALLVWVFQTHRSRGMQVHATEEVQAAPGPAAAAAAPVVARRPAAPHAPETAAPVLNPALKIQQAQRDGVMLQVRLRAQTGEREFAAGVAQVSVEWRLADGTARQEWIALPAAWENFAAKTLAARYDGVAAQIRGCVVRTYYRQQLQDTMAIEPTTP
jgi:hypothetical protein